MKNIAIFCDGTWNRFDAPYRTNVAVLSEALPEVSAAGDAQCPVYVPGVGVPALGADMLGAFIERFGGGAFGWGLDERLEAAYRSVAELYNPGDRLYLFGFSRGAYTVRSLAGLLRNCGIPSAANRHRIGKAIALYRRRKPDSHPDAPASLRFRAEFSPSVATSDTEMKTRARASDGLTRLQIAYLGVWDTVGSLGIPDQFLGMTGLFNRRYRFHDLRLSSMVKSARHAVAIDERRKAYVPTLWENLADLNTNVGAVDYRQEWFPGTHGSVGGGGPERGLSSAALLWIMEGAEQAGLAFMDEARRKAEHEINLLAPLDNRPGPKSPIARLLAISSSDRAPPPSERAISAPARKRWSMHDYRPVPLRPFAPLLDPALMPGDWSD